MKSVTMSARPEGTSRARLIVILGVSLVAVSNVCAQQRLSPGDAQETMQRAQYQEKLQQVLSDKEGYAAAIVRRWESEARENGKWDENYLTDLRNALVKLQPDNLLAAGEASDYGAVMRVLATGSPVRTISPESLGDFNDDLVFTPVPPCRIVDTRVAGGQILSGQTRSFDADNPSGFASQGGSATNCGIPYGVVSAIAVTITATQPSAAGFFTAWAIGSPLPLASNLNWAAGQTIANTTVVPIVPGAGNDWNLFSGGGNVQGIVDVVGYYATPVATALDCITVSSAVTACGVNVWTNVDAACPAGRTATGGGYNTSEGTLGYPGVWVTSLPNGNGWRTWVDNQTNGNRNIQTFANCCRIPGR